MARRTFANLKTAHLARVGRTGDTGYDSAAEELIKAAYFELATLYHHPELDVIDTSKTLSTGTNALALATDTHVISAVILRAVVGGAPIGPLTFHEERFQFALYVASSAQPTAYTRFGDNIYTDKKPDAAYPLSIAYQKRPAEPSFAAGSSLLAVQWDEVLLNWSVAAAFEDALWRPDLAAPIWNRVMRVLEASPQLRLRDLPKHGIPDTPTRGRPHGGPIG